MSDAIRCPQCGVKLSAGRARCPRCRAVITPPDQAIGGKHSPRLLLFSVLLVLAFSGVVLFLWYTGKSSPPSSATVATAPGTGAAPPLTLEPDFLGWSSSPGGSPAELQKTLEQVREVAAANPKDGTALSDLGRIQLQVGKGLDAIASFRAAADANPASWEHRFDLARAQCSLAQWDECIDALGEARKLAPDNMPITYNLGVALHRRGMDDVAVDEFKKAHELASEEPAAVLGMAISYDKLGRTADAAGAYQEYLRLVPGSPLADRIRARISQLGSVR